MGFVNEGTKITNADARTEMTISKDNILKVDVDKIVIRNNNMISWMKWREIEYFKFQREESLLYIRLNALERCITRDREVVI